MVPLLRTDNVVHGDEMNTGVFSHEDSAKRLGLPLGILGSSTGRRVRFEPSQPKILNLENEYLSHEDLLNLWWTADELIAIQNKARMFCSLLRTHGANQDCHLTTAHRKVTLFLASKFRSLLKLSPSSPDQDLSKWCTYNDGRRGLERYVSRVYSSFRQRDVFYTRMAVLTEQARQSEQHINCPDTIAVLSQSAKQRARTFAALLASADASVAMMADAELRPPSYFDKGKPSTSWRIIKSSNCFQTLIIVHKWWIVKSLL